MILVTYPPRYSTSSELTLTIIHLVKRTKSHDGRINAAVKKLKGDATIAGDNLGLLEDRIEKLEDDVNTTSGKVQTAYPDERKNYDNPQPLFKKVNIALHKAFCRLVIHFRISLE